MGKIEQSVLNVVDPIAKQNGCEVIDVEFKKLQGDMHLVIYIDKPGGVTLNDCEAVHNAIDQPLDELDPTNGASYILNVSSPGLDRNINNDKELTLAQNLQVDVKTFAAIDGKKQFLDVTLCGHSEAEITISENNKTITIPRKLISKITKTIQI